jgi:hypothetical protein
VQGSWTKDGAAAAGNGDMFCLLVHKMQRCRHMENQEQLMSSRGMDTYVLA